jgi:hypothetical protein
VQQSATAVDPRLGNYEESIANLKSNQDKARTRRSALCLG